MVTKPRNIKSGRWLMDANFSQCAYRLIYKKKPWAQWLFFQSCWPTRSHIGRSTGISNPAWHLPQVVPRVVQTTGSVHPQPILPNCQLCISTEPTNSIGRLIKSSRFLKRIRLHSVKQPAVIRICTTWYQIVPLKAEKKVLNCKL